MKVLLVVLEPFTVSDFCFEEEEEGKKDNDDEEEEMEEVKSWKVMQETPTKYKRIFRNL